MTVTRYVRTVDLEGRPVDPAEHTGTADALEPAPPVIVAPSSMPWRDESVGRRLAAVESLPPVSRRHAVRAYIADREAELAIYAEAHPAPVDLRELRTGDELLTGLYLVDTLLAS